MKTKPVRTITVETNRHLERVKRLCEHIGFTVEYGTTWQLTEYLSEIAIPYLRVLKDGVCVSLIYITED